MSLALTLALEPKIEQLLETLGRIAEAGERSAAALEKLAGTQTDTQVSTQADASDDGDPAIPDMDLGRLDGLG